MFDKPDPLGLAVSGGGDSMAMLHLAVQWAKRANVGLRAVTVDHGLRPEAAGEAKFVAKVCHDLGVPHDTLKWDHDTLAGNLQDQARRARYRLMADWAKEHGITAIALAHTEDDQAETFLMRLAREAGVDGLSGMQKRRKADGITWLRPLLVASGDDLRSLLTRSGHAWREDPSNQNTRFERVKARQVMTALEPLGITADKLAGVASQMWMARQALDVQTLKAATDFVTVDRGDLVISWKGFLLLPPEIQRRLLQASLRWVSSAEYPVRSQKLTDFEVKLIEGEQATLSGCIAFPEEETVRITRELKAVSKTVCASDQLWDGRWRVEGAPVGTELRALGEVGLPQCPDWREAGLPRRSLLASPAVWQDDELIAAPLAGLENGCSAKLARGDDSFYSLIISH